MIPQFKFGKRLSFVVLCLLSYSTMKGQKSEMATDRPDQTEASSVVGKGVLQIETGVVFTTERIEFFSGMTNKTRDFATTLVRYGIFDNLELRLASAFREYDPEQSVNAVSGLQPMSIGAKIAIADERGCRPEIAFIGHLTLPWIGEESFRPEYVAPDFRLSFSHTLSDRFALGYNVGMEWDGVEARSTLIYTIAVGASLFGPVSAFAELFGGIPERTNWRHNADFGFTVLITPDLQFDASYGLDLSERNPDTKFLNAGVSMRFGRQISE